MKNIKYILKNMLIIIIIVGLLYLLDDKNIWNKQTNNPINNDLEIEVIDVGEGDSILIQYKGNNILIDAGNNRDGNKLVNYFKELNINHFNMVFVTHNHEDHIGGMDNIIRSFSIDKFYMTETETNFITYTEVIEELKKNNIQKEIPKIDQEFKIDDLILKVLWIGNSEDLNENSIILKLIYKNTSYLFTGDAPVDVENQILEKDLKSDVLKVGHHGSRYSTSANFLEKVHPEIAIISVEDNNDYGFPHQVTLDKLQRINTKIYRTDIDGTIIIKSDGENIKIESKKTDTNEKENK